MADMEVNIEGLTIIGQIKCQSVSLETHDMPLISQPEDPIPLAICSGLPETTIVDSNRSLD